MPAADGDVGDLVEVVVTGEVGVSSVNLKVDLPPLVERDKEAHPQLFSTSLNRTRSCASSALIFLEISEETKLARSSRNHVLPTSINQSDKLLLLSKELSAINMAFGEFRLKPIV